MSTRTPFRRTHTAAIIDPGHRQPLRLAFADTRDPVHPQVVAVRIPRSGVSERAVRAAIVNWKRNGSLPSGRDFIPA